MELIGNHASHFNDAHARLLFEVVKLITNHVESFSHEHDLPILPTMNHILGTLVINSLRFIIAGYQKQKDDPDSVAQDCYKICIEDIVKSITHPMIVENITKDV